jgi:hydrogenase nickel incorporation protein HypA/HybF
MHEMGIALEIIDIATASIPADLVGAKVARVNLEVGKLSAIVPDSLRFCFSIATKETALEGAELVIDTRPVVAVCKGCGLRWTIESPVFTCPECEGTDLTLASGRELDITSIEIAEEED